MFNEMSAVFIPSVLRGYFVDVIKVPNQSALSEGDVPGWSESDQQKVGRCLTTRSGKGRSRLPDRFENL